MNPIQQPLANPDMRILEPGAIREPLLPGRTLVRGPGSIGGGDTTILADAVGVTNQATSGTYTLDGVALTVGMKVLLTGQSAAAQNGVYKVQSGTWTGPGQPNTVFIKTGTNYKYTGWLLAATNTYKGVVGFYA